MIHATAPTVNIAQAHPFTLFPRFDAVITAAMHVALSAVHPAKSSILISMPYFQLNFTSKEYMRFIAEQHHCPYGN
jgi:hypothetical protein